MFFIGKKHTTMHWYLNCTNQTCSNGMPAILPEWAGTFLSKALIAKEASELVFMHLICTDGVFVYSAMKNNVYICSADQSSHAG
jgi:hypothetical protein